MLLNCIYIYKLILPFLPEYDNFKVIDTPGSGYFNTIIKIDLPIIVSLNIH